MFNEANKKQVLEMQTEFYSKRIGNVYGDFEVVDIWYDWQSKNQIWRLVCCRCGKEKTTHNGKDYVKGKNKGICNCRAEDKRKVREEEKNRIIANKRGGTNWIGKQIGMWKIIGWNGRMWKVECQECKKTIYKRPAELLKEKAPICLCARKNGEYTGEEWIGKRFGKLIIKRYDNKKYKFFCVCDCGNEVFVNPSLLIKGKIKTCGNNCKYHESAVKRTHGFSHERLYKIWCGMKERCYNPNSQNYKTYGGRGIDICPEWRDDVIPFIDWAKSNGYSDDLSIDRIDNDRGYYPDNCRWATAKEQANNQHAPYTFTEKPPRRTRKNKRRLEWEINGETKSAIEWCEQYGVSVPFVMYRIKNNGMTPLEALTSPKNANGRPRKNK